MRGEYLYCSKWMVKLRQVMMELNERVIPKRTVCLVLEHIVPKPLGVLPEGPNEYKPE